MPMSLLAGRTVYIKTVLHVIVVIIFWINTFEQNISIIAVQRRHQNHRHLGSVEKNKPPPQPSSPINFCILAFFHLKYDILYAWSYTGVRKNDLEHMENIWKKCILLTMIEKTQDKQLRLCNFEPPSPSKVQCARNTKQTHKTLSPINSIYIYLLPDIGSFL